MQWAMIVTGVIAAICFVAIVATGIHKAHCWRKYQGQVLRPISCFKGPAELSTGDNAHEKDVVTVEGHEKDGEITQKSDVENQVFELDAQSVRSFRTRASRAFSLRKKRKTLPPQSVELSGKPSPKTLNSRSSRIHSQQFVHLDSTSPPPPVPVVELPTARMKEMDISSIIVGDDKELRRLTLLRADMKKIVEERRRLEVLRRLKNEEEDEIKRKIAIWTSQEQKQEQEHEHVECTEMEKS